MNVYDQICNNLVNSGFLDAQVHDQGDGEILLEVRFKWKWSNKCDVRTDGKRYLDTKPDQAVKDALEWARKQKEFEVLLT